MEKLSRKEAVIRSNKKRAKSIIGKRYGRLVVVSKIDNEQHVCLCECGNTKTYLRSNLRQGTTNSCGCLKKELVSKRFKKSNSRELEIGRYYRRNAVVRGLVWDIQNEFEELLHEECAYCGLLPAMGVDRVNNNYGYTVINSVPCCKRCNQAKNDITYDEFVTWIKRAYKHITENLED